MIRGQRLPVRPGRTAPKPAVRLAPIIGRLPAIVTVESACRAVNIACGVLPDESGPDLPSRTYSWSEIYDQLREQGYVSTVIHRELVPGALWSRDLIPAFRRFTLTKENA